MSAASTPIADLRGVKSSGRLRHINVFAQARRGAGGSAKQQKQGRARDEVAVDTVAIIAKRVPPDKRNLSMIDRLEDLGIDSFSAVEMIYDPFLVCTDPPAPGCLEKKKRPGRRL